MFCFINPVGLKLLLFFAERREFDKKADSFIRDFFVEANRQLANILMNPLYKRGEEIRSPLLEEKIMAAGK